MRIEQVPHDNKRVLNSAIVDQLLKLKPDCKQTERFRLRALLNVNNMSLIATNSRPNYRSQESELK